MRSPALRPSIVLAMAMLSLGAPTHPAWAQSSPRHSAAPVPASDLDLFMEKVLARREVNRKTLNDYVLDETESFEILGPGRSALHRLKREYTWYVRDGMHVRSPVRFDGVTVGDDARDAYEQTWMRRERRRQERRAKKDGTESGADLGAAAVPTEPRFVSEAYFMDFTFEPGHYLLAGRETLEGHEVLRIEYYPTRLFRDDEEAEEDKPARGERHAETRDERREREQEDDIGRRMNKTALVTLWIDPAEHQIVKYTFDNVWLDFLPGAWLVRVDDIRASMTMGQPFPGVWLPREINIHGGATLASGSFEVTLSRAFSDYREAQVSTKVRVPEVPEVRRAPGSRVPGELQRPPGRRPRGPALAETDPEEQETVEKVREVRVHGNAFISDEDVIAMAGVAVGSPVGPDELAAVQQRLKDTGRFDTVDVRKRYRSLTDPTDVAIVLVVHERPGVTSMDSSVHPATRPFKRLSSRIMFLPILSYADGYGVTYGARFSTVDAFGAGERVSLPLTWGGTKRAALEVERTFARGPLTRVTSSVAIWHRENPRFAIDEQRIEFRAGAERQLAQIIRLGLDMSRSRVDFGTTRDRQWTVGATAALDTRANPAFPANAVYIGGGWTGLYVSDRSRIDRYTADGRGYLRLVGQTVLAARAQYFTSGAALPSYERLLLGGASTLRGFRAGAFDGDTLLVTSAELRVPITSVIRSSRFGLNVFIDAARATDHGTPLGDAEWRRGAGAGVFLIASVVRLNLDVARGPDGGGTRVHLASGFAF